MGELFLFYIFDYFIYFNQRTYLTRLAWAFYSFSSLDALEASTDGEELSEELEDLLTSIETLKGEYFPPGRNSRIQPVILNHNTVQAYVKPLLVYGVVWMLEGLGFLVLRVWVSCWLIHVYSPFLFS